MSEPTPDVAIMGAGLAGALAAVYLGRRNLRVELYEKRPDMRKQTVDRGRSINLALSARGIHALEQAGVAAGIMEKAIPMRGRMMHSTSGELTFQPYGVKDTDVINSVSRAGLNMALLDAAEKLPNVSIRFAHPCMDVSLDPFFAEVRDGVSGEIKKVEAPHIIGADGAFSAVRARLTKQDRFTCRQEFLEHGYKELTIPPTAGGDFAMEPNALHIWPRGAFMLIALPNADKSFTCTLFLPFLGRGAFEQLHSPQAVTDFFHATFPDAVPLMPRLKEEFFANPTSSLVTIRCGPWHVGGKLTLLGDAAHAVVPFYGQGMNAAFEDCFYLDKIIHESNGDWEHAFRRYYEARKPNTDTLAELALENFVEMRDKVADPAFLRKKKFEKTLARLFPKSYIPLYTLVSFTLTPYAEAVEQARMQDAVVERIVNDLRRAGIAITIILLTILAMSLFGPEASLP
ncbi:MAG: Kynurenine 3-monooxygenase [Myxococcota bacterium]|nr:Kynurenine 3-monooxygenase [Myxococcota bacterium]